MSRMKTDKGEIVYSMGPAGSMWTLCLFPFKKVSRAGNRGDVRPVLNSNLRPIKSLAGE